MRNLPSATTAARPRTKRLPFSREALVGYTPNNMSRKSLSETHSLHTVHASSPLTRHIKVRSQTAPGSGTRSTSPLASASASPAAPARRVDSTNCLFAAPRCKPPVPRRHHQTTIPPHFPASLVRKAGKSWNWAFALTFPSKMCCLHARAQAVTETARQHRRTYAHPRRHGTPHEALSFLAQMGSMLSWAVFTLLLVEATVALLACIS